MPLAGLKQGKATGGRRRPVSGEFNRRRRGKTGGGARGDRGEPSGGFGARGGGRTGADHGALLQAATAS